MRAKPLFPGHLQPHLPADLGFYDLRLKESRSDQAELAREYGIHAFCYYHYWFGGRRILERPFQEILDSGEPNFPFCLCWANENWTRTWDGGDDEILLEQKHGDEDHVEHATWLTSAMRDSRWLRVRGCPVLMIYRATRILSCDRFVRILRESALQAGLPGVHVVRVESFPDERGTLPVCFDASMEFQPDQLMCPRPLKRGFWRRQLMRKGLLDRVWLDNHIRSYPELVELALSQGGQVPVRYPCVTPMWDNSARRKIAATVYIGSTPELYGNWLRETIAKSPLRGDDDIVFVNAWNEWAEGNHLEPCQRWGRAYLEATRNAIEEGVRLRSKFA